MARNEREYDWLDDPFNERKDATRMGGGSKAMVGIGCVVALILIVALLVIGITGSAGVAATM